MSDFDLAETIVSAERLAAVLAISPAQIAELTRLGILRPVERDANSTDCLHRYEFLESIRAYLRHLRARYDKEN